MEQVWTRLRAWLVGNTSELGALLNPPATHAQIEHAEAAMGLRFPPSLRLSYLCHDGESPDSAGLFELWRFLPLDEVVEWWNELRDCRTGDPGDFDTTSCIPVLWSEGDVCYVRTSPSDAETPLIAWSHDGPAEQLGADSFGAFITQFADAVERAEYVEDEDGMLALQRAQLVGGR